MSLYEKVVKLAFEKKELRPHLMPLIKKAGMQKKAGYTHYWEITEPFSDQEWSQLVREAKKIVQSAERDGITIKGGGGTGRPEFTDTLISLNGDGSAFFIPEWAKKEDNPEQYRTDEMHEALYLQNIEKWAFCKTARKPYDPVVVSILAAAKKIAPDKIGVDSDGGASAIKRVY